MTEILVIPTVEFLNLRDSFPNKYSNLELIKNLIDSTGRYMERDLAEKDENFLQIIPYTIVRKNNDIFAYRRLKKGKESRLHAKMSIGVGGHVDMLNSFTSNWNTVNATIMNELYEELDITTSTTFLTPKYMDLVIFDPSNEVGRVHLGLVYEVELEDRSATVRETDKLEGRFYTIDELKEVKEEEYENWTNITLKEKIFNTTPTIQEELNENNVIKDYVMAHIGRPYTKIFYIEDIIETLPEDVNTVVCTYSLYEVYFEDNTSIKLVHTMGKNGSVVLEATPEVLADIFGEVKENDKTV